MKYWLYLSKNILLEKHFIKKKHLKNEKQKVTVPLFETNTNPECLTLQMGVQEN